MAGEDMALDEIRWELDRLVERRLYSPFTEAERRRYGALIARERALRGEADLGRLDRLAS